MSAVSPLAQGGSNRSFYAFTAVFSVVGLSAIAYVILIRHGSGDPHALSFLPAVNATLNGIAGGCLLLGFVAIRTGARRVHQYLMTSALAASGLFFASYLAYHYVHGDTKYPPGVPGRAFYFAVLASHVLLSAAVVPLSLCAFFFAWRKSFGLHKRVTRWLLPIWLYVSVTGVAIFFLLRHALAQA